MMNKKLKKINKITMNKDFNENENDFIATDSVSKTGEKNDFDCAKRNTMLLRLFKKLFPKNDIRIMGDENNPAVVIDHEFILSCYVSNYKVRFTNKNWKGDVVFVMDLNQDVSELNLQQVNDWYTQSQHRKINRVYLACENTQAPLYLVGWNFKNKTLKEGKYPVFGEYEPKVYFKKEKAEEVQTELIQMGYNVIVI